MSETVLKATCRLVQREGYDLTRATVRSLLHACAVPSEAPATEWTTGILRTLIAHVGLALTEEDVTHDSTAPDESPIATTRASGLF